MGCFKKGISLEFVKIVRKTLVRTIYVHGCQDNSNRGERLDSILNIVKTTRFKAKDESSVDEKLLRGDIKGGGGFSLN